MKKQEAVEQLIHDSLVVGAAHYGVLLTTGRADTSTPVVEHIGWNQIEAVLDVKADVVAQLVDEPEPDPTASTLLERLRFLVDARAEYTHNPNDPNDPIATEVNAGSLLLAILSGENDATGWLPSWKWGAWKALIEEADRA